jgi:hypothetical protein
MIIRRRADRLTSGTKIIHENQIWTVGSVVPFEGLIITEIYKMSVDGSLDKIEEKRIYPDDLVEVIQ